MGITILLLDGLLSVFLLKICLRVLVNYTILHLFPAGHLSVISL
jgi:hypothetical protein